MAKKLWGGRFRKQTDPYFEKFSASIDTDCRLAAYDLIGSFLHVHVLRGAGLITAADFSRLKKGLLVLLDQVEKGTFAYDFSCEDIHTNIQIELAKKAGASAKKLQTCRSRNDQVVFATKLYCLMNAPELQEAIFQVRKSLLAWGALHGSLVMPGYTHLQHAQPVYFKDYCAAYSVMFNRDAERLEDALKRLGVTMGSGALAGTPIPAAVYKTQIKKALASLKMKGLSSSISSPDNALATVSDRDFVIELLSVFAVIGMHISRLCEDLILWSSHEFGFIEVGDAYCTGSSLMPQKKNPDALELLRGASGPLAGHLMAVLTTMKGLPLSYNRDMQWDKGPLFASFELVEDMLIILSDLIPTIKVHKSAIARQVDDESLYATDLADLLVSSGASFSEAHEAIGRLVAFCQEQDKKIRHLSESELKRFHPSLKKKEVLKKLDPAKAAAARKSVR
jgi:argininosuccinate lyase